MSKSNEEIVEEFEDISCTKTGTEIQNWLIAILTTKDQQCAQKVEEARERIVDIVVPKAQKFIDKVESGRARSKETYADMKEIVQALTNNNNR